MTHYVGVKELRQNMDKYARRVQRGHKVVVLKHNKPLFEMSPVTDPFGDEGTWETVVDFTKIRKGGVPIEDVLKALKELRKEEDAKKTNKK